MREIVALLFPTSLHERGVDPGPFTNYQPYKPHLRREFRRKCVYCRISDGIKGEEGFDTDHYLPKSKFPHLAVTWSNLFYACHVCNTWKGNFASSPERFLPNPCAHRMSDHLQYQGAEIGFYTLHGKWLDELLHLSERRSLREFVLSALGKFLVARNELVGDLTFFEARLEQAQSGGEIDSLQALLQDTVEELENVDQHIERLIGEPLGLE